MEYSIGDLSVALAVLDHIEQVQGTNDKKYILSQHTDNNVLRVMLRVAYDPYTQFYIKKIPITMEECKLDTEVTRIARFTEFLSLLYKLNSRTITGNKAIDELSDFLRTCNNVEYKWYTRVIQKDLKIGLADKGINSVIKNLIPKYEVLLAEKIEPSQLESRDSKTMKMLPDEFYTQYKIDGYRLNIHVLNDGSVMIRTRNGKEVSGYNDLVEEAKAKLPKGYVYDGELTAPELNDWIENNKKTAVGVTADRNIFSETMSHAFSKENDKKGVFNLFDMVPIEEWNTNKTTESLETRLSNITNLVKPLNLVNIRVVETSGKYTKDDIDTVLSEFYEFLRIGYEGIMIKDATAKYEFKRSKSLIKMKLMDTLDLTVTDIYEGTGKYKGMMGGVYVDYKGYQVGVGSGWNDEQRLRLWKNPNEIVGKTIEVSYQAETTNKQGQLSLSFPVVIGVRNDK